MKIDSLKLEEFAQLRLKMCIFVEDEKLSYFHSIFFIWAYFTVIWASQMAGYIMLIMSKHDNRVSESPSEPTTRKCKCIGSHIIPFYSQNEPILSESVHSSSVVVRSAFESSKSVPHNTRIVLFRHLRTVLQSTWTRSRSSALFAPLHNDVVLPGPDAMLPGPSTNTQHSRARTQVRRAYC